MALQTYILVSQHINALLPLGVFFSLDKKLPDLQAKYQLITLDAAFLCSQGLHVRTCTALSDEGDPTSVAIKSEKMK